MPSRIELSPQFVSGNPSSLTNRIMTQPFTGSLNVNNVADYGLFANIYNSNYNPSGAAAQSDGYHGGSALSIMKGTIPSSISQIAPTMRLTEANNRGTDACLIFQAGSTHFSPSQYQVNPLIISTIFVPAILTGTVSWFWYRNWGSIGGPGLLFQSFIGTVGLLGSGSDLEMADVNILSGDNYRISAMKLEFPTSWEF